jgi:membrane protein implicated in regulation of membrane protease activity
MMEYLAENIWAVWLIVSIACMITELTSGDLYLLCFSIGALGSMVASLLGLPTWVQTLTLAVVAVLCLCFVRPPLLRRLHRGDNRKSNADALIGRKAVVKEPIPADGYGYVKIDGDEWRSESADGTPIAKGIIVEVVSRNSTILTVKQK